jgi:glycosyltransferase involved in cell wall biosynthesis
MNGVMRKILFLLPDFEYSGIAQQVNMLASGLPRDCFESLVCGLGRDGPVADELRAAGIPCMAFGWRHWLDVRVPLQVRRMIRDFGADVVHAWGTSSLHVASIALAAGSSRTGSRLVYSAASTSVRPSAVWAELDRRLLQLNHETALIPPGVPVADSVTPLYPANLRAGSRFIACVGPVEPHKGFATAIWAIDILRYLYRDLHLVIAGEGSDIPRLQQFARNIGATGAVHFVGRQKSISPLLAAAEVVWVPSVTCGGRLATLEAMAAGRPVIASAVPELAQLVDDGVTGMLALAQDPVALARRTRILLDDPSLRVRMGQAGRQHVQQSFTAAHLVERFERLYNAPAEESSYPMVSCG